MTTTYYLKTETEFKDFILNSPCNNCVTRSICIREYIKVKNLQSFEKLFPTNNVHQYLADESISQLVSKCSLSFSFLNKLVNTYSHYIFPSNRYLGWQFNSLFNPKRVVAHYLKHYYFINLSAV